MTNKPKRLVVIDGKSVFYRGYYAMPNLSTADGTPTGGVFGFASLALEIIKKLEPDYVAVAWDKSKTNIRKRREIYPEYKAGRKAAPADFYEQIPILREMLEAFGWPLYELDDYEADDLMATFAAQAGRKGIETCLITSDLDALQAIDSLTSVYAIKNGLANIEKVDVAAFEDKYGLKVNQFLDLKSLKGDSSDNLPGVPGVGEKTAASLLQEYGTLEAIYENIDTIKPAWAKKLEAGKDLAFMTKKVAELWSDAPVEFDWQAADINNTDLAKVADILKRLEFTSLLRRLPEHMQQVPDKGLYFEEHHQFSISESPWPKELLLETETVVHLVGDELLVAPNKQVVWRKSIGKIDASFWSALAFTKLISYDIKQLLHDLDRLGIELKIGAVHDIRQAAFLIDPLRRDRSLEALAGGEMAGDIDRMAALWQVYLWQQDAFSHEKTLATAAEQFDFPVIYSLFLMEKRGIKIDKTKFETMSQEIGQEYSSLEAKIYQLVGREFNIASPSQLSEALFVDLGLPVAGIKKGKTGYSTDQKTLDKLRSQHEIIELIERSRELSKLKNTYVDVLPGLADSADRVHTTFAQDVAATGRLSSSHPNLQNIPIRTELGRKVRQAFVPSSGKVFVSADYSQFELRLAAVLAGDKALIDDFNSGVDIHAKTASDVYGVPLAEVTKEQRRDAKVINFGVLYGMSPHGLAAATGMSFYEAKHFIDHYFMLRAPIRKFIDKTLADARINGYVSTFYGRRRPTPDIHSSNFIVRQSAERAAANMPIQGTEADLMKRSMLAIEDKMSTKADQLLQIHDSILVECDKQDADEVASRMKEIMESIAPELKVSLKVDVSVGENWGEL